MGNCGVIMGSVYEITKILKTFCELIPLTKNKRPLDLYLFNYILKDTDTYHENFCSPFFKNIRSNKYFIKHK